MATDTTTYRDLENGVDLSATWTFDDVTGDISQYVWANNGTRDVFVIIRQVGKPDVSTTLGAGKTGTRRNVPTGYNYNTSGIEFRVV